MIPFSNWFSRRNGASRTSEEAAAHWLQHARALEREGLHQQASDAYWKIKRKQRTVDGLLEHADILFELGDYFRSAAMAGDVLELEPDNARAKAVQSRVRRAEEAERRR